MILLNKASYVILDEDTITPKKVIKGIVKFNTPEIGKVIGWIQFLDENDSEVVNGLITEYLQTYFTGEKVDILNTLSTEFKNSLSILNPTIQFTISQ